MIGVRKTLARMFSFFLAFMNVARSVPPLHDLGAHLDETDLCFAFGEEGNRFDGFVDVCLCQCACLF
jgi:hypothetical protein